MPKNTGSAWKTKYSPINRNKMKAITVKQPWASLIVEGIKDIENRTWKTNFRGRVLIHAGVTPAKGWTKRDGGAYVLNDKQYFTVTVSDKFAEIFGSHLTFGAIIGSVEIVDCVVNHPSIWAEKSHMLYDGFSPSEYDITYNWVLSNPILFDKPIPCKGKLSFWEFEMPENVQK